MNTVASAMSPNLLPFDGIVTYHETFLDHQTASTWFKQLLHESPWQQDEVVLFGKRLTTQRKVAWHGEPGCTYRYSGTVKKPHPWPPLLMDIKRSLEEATGTTFNCCLLNLYHHGGEGMGWHSDDEKELVQGGQIASLSLGAERRFLFKHRRITQEKVSLTLHHGSLLLMAGTTQQHWLHSLPKMMKIHEPRINLTFRQMRLPTEHS